MRTLATADEFGAAIDEAMRPALADPALREALAASIRDAENELRAEPSEASAGLNLRLGHFVLRDEDLPVAEAIALAASTAVTLLAPGVLVAAAVITAVGSFSTLAWKAWRKGARLSSREITILGLLKVNGPLTDEELAALAAKADPALTPQAVAASLASLGDVELRDGDIVSLVRKDASDRFVARAV
ncbi:MAG TPA: hypothetical protein VF718_04690 [Allosphingosinicella sp.]|jgi:hypothetical protein